MRQPLDVFLANRAASTSLEQAALQANVGPLYREPVRTDSDRLDDIAAEVDGMRRRLPSLLVVELLLLAQTIAGGIWLYRHW